MTYEEITANAHLIADGYYHHQAIHKLLSPAETVQFMKLKHKYIRLGDAEKSEAVQTLLSEMENILDAEYESYLDDFQCAEKISCIREYIAENEERQKRLTAVLEELKKYF